MSKNNHTKTDHEKTSVVSSNTTTIIKGRLKDANETPPAIVCLMGPQSYIGKQWSLVDSELVIGRSVESKIFIDDKSLSRQHARINISGGDVLITDLGSTNKTSVNGQVLPPNSPLMLKNDDRIKTGSVVFKFLEQGNVEVVANKELNERVTKDALTGANNRAYLNEKGPEAVKRSEILGEPLTIMVFDIDHFKKINDTYGHAAGDYILKELSDLVSTKVVRSNDFFARYGGEEFVVLLNGSANKVAIEVAERLRTTVESQKFEFEGKPIKVTISIGIATKNPRETDWLVLFKRADEALYKSKNSGRNRVTSA